MKRNRQRKRARNLNVHSKTGMICIIVRDAKGIMYKQEKQEKHIQKMFNKAVSFDNLIDIGPNFD